MVWTGGCYCGAVRYRAEGKALFKAQCHCRECQYISGGGPNYFLMVGHEGFAWTAAEPAAFARSDLDSPVTRRFCATCGTHISTERPGARTYVLKAGTLDDPASYGGPTAAIYMCDTQAFHLVPEGLPAFDKLPPR